MRELAEEYKGRLRVAKIDADANPELAAKYQVRALPTVLFLKDGNVSSSLVGNQPKATLQSTIDDLDRAITLDPDRYELYVQRADARLGLGHLESAVFGRS